MSSELSIDAIRVFSAGRDEPKWLLKKRLDGLKQFEKFEAPNFSYGLGINLNTDTLDLEIAVPKNLWSVASEITSTADKEIIVKKLSDAVKDEDLKDYLFKTSPVNKIEALHQAVWSEGLFVKITKGKEVKTPVNITSDAKAIAIAEHNLFIAEPGSKMTVVQKSIGKPQFKTSNIEIHVQDSARIQYGEFQNLSEKTNYFSKKIAYVQKDATIDWIACDIGARFGGVTLITNLEGRGSKVSSRSMFFGRGEQNFDFYLVANHKAKDTTSYLDVKGALDGKSKAIYRGLVRIEKGAPNSDGYQNEETLLLSSDAEASAVPNLEIDNNDVKCSHGTAIGQIDKSKLFYMMTRGMDEITAKRKLVEGFFEPFIQKIPVDVVKADLKKIILERIGGINELKH
jgi:Fe-S cluster assembly protein SufD